MFSGIILISKNTETALEKVIDTITVPAYQPDL